jgi:hypothetical protein
MPEQVVGVKPQELVSTMKTKEGSLSFTYSNTDFVANTIGHVLAIPTTHIPSLTFRNIFQNPPPELVDHLRERWKDVPWKGDVLVRVGHNSIFGDIQRLFSKDSLRGPLSLDFGDAKVAKAARLALRILALPYVVFNALKAKLFRSDGYTAITNTVNVFHANSAIGMHETGHAEFFNQEKHRSIYGLFKEMPILKSFTEYKASVRAVAHMKTDSERRQAMKVLEAAWGTYLMKDVMLIALPFVALSPLRAALTATSAFALPFGPKIVQELTKFGFTAGVLAGAASGHILSRTPYPGQRQRFGYIFEGNQTAYQPALADRQMLVAMAKPMR